MLISLQHTIALDAEELKAVLAVRLPIDQVPNTERGGRLVLECRDAQECTIWADRIGDAFETYMHGNIANVSDTVVPEYPVAATQPRSNAKPRTHYSNPFYRALGWTVFWGAILVMGFLTLLRFILP